MKLFAIALLFIVSMSCSSSSPSAPVPVPVPVPVPSPTPTPGLDFCQPSERPMVVTNNSSKAVWLGLTSGSIAATTASDCANFGGQFTTTKSVPGLHGTTVSGVCSCSTTAGTTTSCGSLASCSAITTITNSITPPPTGTTLHYCFWNPPRLVGSQTVSMPTAGSSIKLCFPKPQSGNFQWSGNLFARFGCDSNGQNCDSADCTKNLLASSTSDYPYCPNAPCPVNCNPNVSGSCPKGCVKGTNYCGPGYVVPPGHTYAQDCPNDGTCAPQNGLCILGAGGQPPATLAEFTLTQLDYYDISVINGINMAISMAPDLTNAVLDPLDPYACGTPGAKQQSNSQTYLKGCPWTVNLNIPTYGNQSNLLRQVIPSLAANQTTYTKCPCPSGQICGLALNILNTSQGKFVQTCGTDIKAYWTADEICGTLLPGALTNNDLYPLPCTTTGTTASNNMQTHMFNLFGCTGQDGFSCYQTGAQCGSDASALTGLQGTFSGCGCPTDSSSPYVSYWPPQRIKSTACQGSNPDWTTYIQPWLVYLKQACPTAYTFPYDDVTSTFTCKANSSVTAGSGPGYNVTFFDVN